nr:DAK2 domain-containing protein [Peptoclostridium litorale]
MLIKMFISGANNLENHKDVVDRLNVFPVPDGDTGTNMSLTMNSAVEKLHGLKEESISNVGKTVSKGSLMGARGNSGVILSQLLRGFASAIEEKKTLDVYDFAQAMSKAAHMAYKAVIKPIEGTILTVAREAGEYALELVKEEISIEDFFNKFVGRANESLENTPNLLDALREANVVDSGGKGLVLIYEGMYNALVGSPVQRSGGRPLEPAEELQLEKTGAVDIKYAYCTEFILKSKSIVCDEMRMLMADMGDSMVAASDDDLIKMHIHTNEPGTVLQMALEHGELVKIKIENMRVQHENNIVEKESGKPAETEKKKYSVVAVASGEGMASILGDLGVDSIIEGGQTMNPSTSDFLQAINGASAENVIVFPNNKNIIMAANQAKEMSDENVIVIPTKNMPQAFAAMVAFNPDEYALENEKNMSEAIEHVKVGQVTFSVRDTSLNGKDIKKGDIIGIVQGEIDICADEVKAGAVETAKSMIDEDTEIVSVFYGEDVSEEDANKLIEDLEKEYEDVEFEIYYGGQPVYYYIISAE